jgi:DNA-binding response OmpR family regulator
MPFLYLFIMKKILIVEDENALGEIYQRKLIEVGYAVKWVQTAEAAEELAGSFEPDLVLLDHGLPIGGKSGIEALTSLKKIFTRAIFILFSNYSDLNLQELALKAGAQDCWVKVDLRLQQLVEQVQQILTTPAAG